MAELAIARRGLVAAEFRAHGRVDQLGEVVRHLDIGAKTEEDVAHIAGRILLAPDPAIAEVRNGTDAIVERDALAAARLVDAPLAGRLANLEVGQRQLVAVEQLGDLGGGGDCFAFGAAVGDCLGAQPLDARPKLVEGVAPAQGLMPISFCAVPPRMAIRSSSLSPGVDITRSTSVLVHGNG